MQAINNPMKSKRVVSIFMRTSQHPEGHARTSARENGSLAHQCTLDL
jgi:hypothetical protein